MRITGGIVKGYTIKVPKGEKVRPAQEVVRLAIFNMIGEFIEGAKVLDLFAGSGSLGLEALSRGAAWVDFVDKDKACARVIKENLLHTHFENKAKIHTLKAEHLLPNTSRPRVKYDFIFLSPPYAQGIDGELLIKLPQILKERGLVIFEHGQKTTIPKKIDNLALIEDRKYGAAVVSFLQKKTP